MELQDDHLKQFEDWYEAHLQRLYAFIAYQLGDQAAAEDLTALICEKAMVNLRRYDPQLGTLSAWIYGIARHELQRFRRDHRRGPVQVSLDALPDIIAEGTSIEEMAHHAELTRLVIQYLGKLTQREQEIISLRYGAELPHNEIAHILGLSSGNVRVLLHRALDHLHAILVAQYEAAGYD